MIVIKLGGRVQSKPQLITALSDRWRAEPGTFCVVHGGGDEISALQRQMGREPSFVNGRRVTSEEDIDLVRMVLSGSANKRLVSSMVAAGMPAVGVSGEDAGTIEASPIDLASFGRSGKPDSVRIALIDALFSSGFIPVISPVARDITSNSGAALNINGDDAAAEIAAALRAELWMIADVSGVLDSDGSTMKSLNETEAGALVSRRIVSRGMHAKLEAGFNALSRGASTARIAGLEALMITSVGQGTFLRMGTS